MDCRAGDLPVPAGADFVLESKLMEVYSWRRSLFSRFLAKLAKILVVVGLILTIFSFLPSIWYWLQAGGKDTVSQYLFQTAAKPTTTSPQPLKIKYQPRYDARLPVENRIRIPSVGIDTLIQEATLDNYEAALKKGVWRVSDFGTPYSREKPTILAAHRYGYLAWSIPYRLKNSFYNLPKLKVGDTVEIVWRQRKYVYEVYAEGKGEEIEDYTASLILYTCESLKSPVRIFKYARLLEI